MSIQQKGDKAMYWTEFKQQQKVVDGLIKMRTNQPETEARRLASLNQEMRKLIDIANKLYDEIERRQRQ